MANSPESTNSLAEANKRSERFLIWLGFGFCLKCFAFSLLMVMLLLSILFTALHVPLGLDPFTLAGSLKVIYQAAIIPVAALIGEILKSFSPWGFIAFAILVVILRGPVWIRDSLSSARLKFGSFEFEGAAISTFRRELNEAAGIVERANKEIAEAYNAAKSYASQLRDRYQIGVFTSEVATAVAEIIGPACPEDYQLTLYIPDLVFSDRLYQFTEYYNKRGEPVSENRVGRTYSIRYGIIGRVWRSGVSEIEGELISKEDRDLLLKDPNHGPIAKFIARRWGLTLEEANRIKKYNSYAALRLNLAENKVGVIFFYSKIVNAFGDESGREKTLNEIAAMLEDSPLVSRLLEISHEVAAWSGRIQIFRNS